MGACSRIKFKILLWKVLVVQGDYASKLNAGLLSPTAPDVFTVGPTGLQADAVKAGQYADLSDLFTGHLDDYSSAALDLVTVGGKQYGVPVINDVIGIYYRKSLLQKAGLQPPATLSDLITAANALTTSSMKGIFLGNDTGDYALRNVLPGAAGAGYLTKDGKAPAFNAPGMAQALLQARELVNSKALLSGAPTDWTDPGSFINGLAAMQFGGFWQYPAITQAFSDDFGFLPFPSASAAGSPIIGFGEWVMCVNAKSKHIPEAKAYVKSLWIDDNAVQLDWATGYGYHLPPRLPVQAEATKLQSGGAKTVVDLAAKYGFIGGGPYWTPALDTILATAFANVLHHNANPTTELASDAQKVQAALG